LHSRIIAVIKDNSFLNNKLLYPNGYKTAEFWQMRFWLIVLFTKTKHVGTQLCVMYKVRQIVHQIFKN